MVTPATIRPTFGCTVLAENLKKLNEDAGIESVELIGLCTDICVVSNALLIKAFMPEIPVSVGFFLLRGSDTGKA